MDVISSNAPYIINVGTRDGSGNPLGVYRVYLGNSAAGQLIYSGQLYSEEGGHAVSLELDLQPILVNYTYEYIGRIEKFSQAFSSSTTGSSEYLGRVFYVEYQTTSGSYASVTLYMLYCAENATNSELGFDSSTNTFPMVGNDYIQGKFLNGSYFSVATLFSQNTTSYTPFSIIGVTESGTTGTVYSNPVYMQAKRQSGQLNVPSNYKWIYITINGNRVSDNIEVINCLPENSYIVYYVNSLGAIDWIICDKKNSVTYNADRHNITKYANIANRTAFGKLNYLNNTTKTWTLNTDIMTDEQSKKMYNVFNSPYIWFSSTS